MSGFPAFVDRLCTFLWGYPMLALLFCAGVFFTVRLSFPQRHTLKGIRLSFKKEPGQAGDMTPFSALFTTLAATVGTGNIVGVTTAVSLGGPGAVLWMWLAGVLGMAVTYAECALSVHYRVRLPGGRMAGGPMYVLERGLKSRGLGTMYALLTAVAGLGTGCMVQANSASSLLSHKLSVPPHITGLVLTALTVAVLLGGVKSIAGVCGVLMPFMAVFYLLGCLILLFAGRKTLPASIWLILRSAFSPRPAAGGAAGAGIVLAIRFGLSRGLFSNEAGMGSAGIAAAAAQTASPVRQGLVSATATFWDTVVLCALTGLVVVNSGQWQTGLAGAELCDAVFSSVPVLGSLVLTAGLCVFVFAAIIGWAYYAERAVEYLAGQRLVRAYRLLYSAAVYAGSVLSLSLVWNLADIANALMTLPNLLALFALSPVAVSLTRRYPGLEKKAARLPNAGFAARHRRGK